MGARVPVLPAEEYARRQRRAGSLAPHLWSILDAVKDPEIPSVSIWELGILQNVTDQHGTVVVTITPTYSGCPAIQVITADIQSTLADAGFANSEVVSRLAPAWSTSWLTDDARAKLERAGIAAPAPGGNQGGGHQHHHNPGRVVPSLDR